MSRAFVFLLALLSLGLARAGTVNVTACTTPDGVTDNTAGIQQCAAQAGAGGTLVFPGGTYIVVGLQVLQADQTWLLDRYAVLQKPATASRTQIIENKASGLRLKGGTLKDTLSNLTDHGIYSGPGRSIALEDVRLVDVRGWGIWVNDAPMTLRDVEVRDSLHGAVNWHASYSQRGPVIERVRVYRSNPAKYGTSGGIHVIGAGEAAWNTGTVITNSLVELPAGSGYSAVGIEVWYGEGTAIYANEVRNGRIGYSLYRNQFFRVFGNYSMQAADYAYEMAFVSQGDASHNTGLGGGPGHNWGFEISNASVNNTFTENALTNFAARYNVEGDSLGNTIR